MDDPRAQPGLAHHTRMPTGSSASWHFWRHAFLSALFIASLVHLLSPLPVPLEMPAYSLASNLAFHFSSPTNTVLSKLAIVQIDNMHFDQAYEGTSPLNRCVLHDDLQKIYQDSALKVIAIDLDLSPTLRQGEYEKGCQRQLDALIDSKNNAHRTVLIEPFDMQTHQEYADWMQARQQKGITFGAATLDSAYGMVSHYKLPTSPEYHSESPKSPSSPVLFGERLAQRLCAEPDYHRSNAKACAALRQNEPSTHTASEAESYPIIYNQLRQLHLQGQSITLPLAKDTALAGIEYVLVGAGYSKDDEFLTPIGPLNGVQIHAAIASEPRHTDREWLGFGIDIGLGTGFAWLLALLWTHYFNSKLNQGLGADLAYLWLTGLGAIYLLLIFVLMTLSVILFSHWGLWISPVPMVIGMALDAFVIHGVETAAEKVQKAEAKAAKPTPYRVTTDTAFVYQSADAFVIREENTTAETGEAAQAEPHGVSNHPAPVYRWVAAMPRWVKRAPPVGIYSLIVGRAVYEIWESLA